MRNGIKMSKKLSIAVIERLKPNLEKDVFKWDEELRGFGIRVKSSGTKTFIIQYRNKYGKTRRLAIGQYGRLTPEEARKEAKIKLAEVERDKDPSAERKALKQTSTIKELCEAYKSDCEKGKVLSRGKTKKESTIKVDKGRIDRHIIPLLGSKVVEELSRLDVEKFMHDVIDGKTAGTFKTERHGLARVTGGSGTAKKSVDLLSAIFNYAIKRRLATHNPCDGVEKPKDGKRNRFLTPSEFKRLGEALIKFENNAGNKTVSDTIKALVLTGCRKSEVLELKAYDVDFDGNCLRLTDTKTGSQMRPCGAKPLILLKGRVKNNKNWVFPALRGDGHFVNLPKSLNAICKQAELDGVTAHTFRHSFATVAHELNYSELTIAGLLGHSSGSVTSKYAHHVDEALSNAATKVSSVIAERMGLIIEGNDNDKE